MATVASDIVTLDELKTQLRLPASHTSEDAFFQSLIDSAIAAVSKDTGLSLIDKATTAYAECPKKRDEPIQINVLDFFFDSSNVEHSIKYWTKQGSFADAPDGTIQNDAVTRTTLTDDGRAYLMYAGAGWPSDMLADSNIQINGSVGFGNSDIPEPLVQAVVVMARYLYSGDLKFPVTTAYHKLINPYKRIVRRNS